MLEGPAHGAHWLKQTRILPERIEARLDLRIFQQLPIEIPCEIDQLG